jgi:ribulose-5-phosphate 4-epimerase/fuculose-1-phosphate aldolase
MGMLDRLMRSSVDRAMRMQPRRTQRVADELLSAAPSNREEVGALAEAGRRLVVGGLTPPTLGALAVRRADSHATLTMPGVDLSAIDNRTLESVAIDDRSSPAMAGIRAGAAAAIHAFPPHVIALAEAGLELEPLVGTLADRAGLLVVVGSLDEVATGLSFIPGGGVLATHQTALAAVERLEAADMLAHIQIMKQHGSSIG